jgi:16S rRNA G966 N2-methylase RsmD
MRSFGNLTRSPNTVMGKVKEAVYSTLTYFGVYDDTTAFVRHVDIFAGSGSVGIESLSRGANGCIFVDLSDDCCQCIQHNLERTGLVTTNNNNKDAIQIVRADAMEFFKFPQKFGIQTTCQILTICPPYEEVAYGDVMEAAVSSPVVAESDTILIVEYPVELGTLPHVITASRRNFNENENNNTNYLDHHGFETNTAVGIRNRRYGRTVIAMYVINPSGKLVRADSRPEEFVAPV